MRIHLPCLGRSLPRAGVAVAALVLSLLSPASAGADTSPAPPGASAGAHHISAPPAPTEYLGGSRMVSPSVVCASAHMQTIGWQQASCAGVGSVATVGLPGQGLRMEALSLSVVGSSFCATAYLELRGWDTDWTCAGDYGALVVGSTGQGLRLEAVGFGVQTGRICGNAYVQDVGWQGWYCGDNGETNFAGTTGQGKRIEALSFFVA
ncbi:hypothetical protein [Lentzea sp. NPDC060358]|uniref:hypothetical protein n=1 Tax=Lentzea sp. NPDC060358 TaxID=3347103 RepID=UPI003666228D